MTEETKSKDEKSEAKEKKEPKDNIVSTQHAITIDGREIKYTATSGTMVLKEESEKGGEAKNEN